MNKNEIKAESGHRIIGGALKIKAGDRVYHDGKWKTVSSSIGMTVSQAKRIYNNSVFARPVAIQTDDAVATTPSLPSVPKSKVNIQIVNGKKRVIPPSIPNGYIAIPAGSIKQKGDLYFSENGQWVPVDKSVGKEYKGENAGNVVIRCVATNVLGGNTVAQEPANPVAEIIEDNTKFQNGQRVIISNNVKNASYRGKVGTVIKTRDSRYRPNEKTVIIDLDETINGNESATFREQFVSALEN